MQSQILFDFGLVILQEQFVFMPEIDKSLVEAVEEGPFHPRLQTVIVFRWKIRLEVLESRHQRIAQSQVFVVQFIHLVLWGSFWIIL